MSFSNDWDKKYQESSHLSIWPWSDLVSYVMRYARPVNNSKINVLELGCGAGANIPFFESLGVNYYAIEGSPTIVQMLRNKYPVYSEHIEVGDFTVEIPFDVQFDIIVDRASLTHNDTESIKNCLSMVFMKMLPGASYIGIDWFSTNHADFQKCTNRVDAYTCRGLDNGQFTGLGKVHFSDVDHIRELFKNFEIRMLEEKKVFRIIPSDSHIFASWDIHAVKK